MIVQSELIKQDNRATTPPPPPTTRVEWGTSEPDKLICLEESFVISG